LKRSRPLLSRTLQVLVLLQGDQEDEGVRNALNTTSLVTKPHSTFVLQYHVRNIQGLF